MNKRADQNSNTNEQFAIRDFRYILDTYIKTFFSTHDSFVIRKTGGKSSVKKMIEKKENEIVFYPCTNSPQICARIKTDYKYSSTDVFEYIFKELMRVSQYSYDNPNYTIKRVSSAKPFFNEFYAKALYDTSFQIGMCRYITSGYKNKKNTAKTLLRLIYKLDAWSSKTYEGNKVPFGFIIDCEQKTENSYNYIDFLDNNSSAVFTDGIYGGILLDIQGNFVTYFSYEDNEKSDDNEPLSPYNYIMFTEKCSESKIGVLCLSTGDILLIKDKKLIFSKRNGNWIYYDYNHFRHIANQYIVCDIHDKKDWRSILIDQIYLSILDVSFAHTGGCLAITYHEQFDSYKNAIENDLLDIDLVDEDSDDSEIKKQKDKIRQRKEVIKNLVYDEKTPDTYKEFSGINRKLRQELLGLDGATVVNTVGKLLAAGAIVSIQGGSENGGRTAAAKQLAQYGFSIKISEDGYIQCYAYNKECKMVENVLNFC